MKIRIYKSYGLVSEVAADIIDDVIAAKPDAILGLATGSTPIETYGQLIRRGVVDFSKVSSYNLDEYIGLAPTDPQSYHYYMKENFFDHINIDQSKTHLPNGQATDPVAEAAAFEAKILEAGGVDVQLLGIGENGHIGFNEPADHFKRFTHVADLTESTIAANAIHFDKKEDVPTQAISMGIGTIMSAKKIILIASGPKKAQAIKDALQGEINPAVQASILQCHPDVTVILDYEAASLLEKKLDKRIQSW